MECSSMERKVKQKKRRKDWKSNPKKVKTTKETISKETKRQDQKRKGKERTGRKGKITKVEGRKHCRVSPFSAQRADRDLARERERELGKETEDHTFGWQVQGVW